jgi:hypothetical protein
MYGQLSSTSSPSASRSASSISTASVRAAFAGRLAMSAVTVFTDHLNRVEDTPAFTARAWVTFTGPLK